MKMVDENYRNDTIGLKNVCNYEWLMMNKLYNDGLQNRKHHAGYSALHRAASPMQSKEMNRFSYTFANWTHIQIGS